ncbi:MAG: cell shape determination protein CcmA [Nitrospira sp. CR1.2]|nr:cell shape determination protein CcmA [Nitrospira sp. CR1.2]
MLGWFTGSSATACDKELAMMKKSGFVESDNITLLAKGVLLRGEICVEGTVRIDGRLEGDLQTVGTVVIGEDGVVQGTITAGIVISSGKIKATVRATERLQLLKTGLLIGEVHAPAFSMEDGAKFQGTSDMGVSSWSDDAQKLPANVRDIASQRPKAVAAVGENA